MGRECSLRRSVLGWFWGILMIAVIVPAGETLAQTSDSPPLVKYFIDVRMTDPGDLDRLAALGFDIAGVDRGEGKVGIIATSGDLDRLASLRFVYSIREKLVAGEGVRALSQYTDPQELSVAMDQIVANYPTLAKKITLAQSLYEGQKVYALKITKDVDLDNDRPTFVVDAQHHAREVMTPEIALDMMQYLTSRYATDPQVMRWVDNINIYVVPSVNPDGAMYVFTTDTGWRKNRNPGCAVDINRNYPFRWAACNGSSGECTSDTFRGTSAGSEPETQAMLSLNNMAHAFFTLSYHSYGQYIMYSYGCDDPNERAALQEVAQALNTVLPNDNGVTGGYAVGPIGSTLYQVDGGSIDYQYGVNGAYGYTIEVNSSSFQPDYATWRDITVQRQRNGWQFFLDRILDGPQIRGHVTDAETGLPLQAQVSVQEVVFTHGEAPRYADAKGRYHWLTTSGSVYHITFSMPGFCSQTHEVTVGTGPVTLDVALGVPPAPDGVSAASGGDNRIDLSWLPVDGAAEYRIFRSLTAGGPYTQVGTAEGIATSYTDNTVSGDVTYYYIVRTYTQCESHDSTEVSAATTGQCTLAPQFSGVGSVSDQKTSTCALQVSWAAAAPWCPGRVTYRVYRSTTTPFDPGPAHLIASGLSGLSFIDHAALTDATTYYYIVRAIDSSSGTEDANTVILSGTPTGPQVSGTWSDDAGDTGLAKLDPTAPWSVLSTGGKTKPKVYATGPYSNSQCAAVTTPEITLQTNSYLSFHSKYDLESNYDAGIVEVATGPAFSNWTKLTTVNYPDALTYGGNACGFPASGGGTVFCRSITTPAYTSSPYSGSLSAYNNKTVKVRWRFGSDGFGTRAGWWIDDIKVTNALIPTACTAGTASNPKEVSPNAAPMTCHLGGEDGAIEVTYEPGCGALDTAAFWGTGPITGAAAWTQAACGLGNTGWTSFNPGDPGPGGLYYFVLVGQNNTKEGSYGQSCDGTTCVERPEATGIGACDKPQDLTGPCP